MIGFLQFVISFSGAVFVWFLGRSYERKYPRYPAPAVTETQHNRGVRGFERPAARTDTTEAKIHRADFRSRAETYDTEA